jgi:hypothetical protein
MNLPRIPPRRTGKSARQKESPEEREKKSKSEMKKQGCKRMQE